MTPQQRRVLIRIGVGCTIKDVATQLRISERTVKHHIEQLMAVFNVPNRGALLREAHRRGHLRHTRIVRRFDD